MPPSRLPRLRFLLILSLAALACNMERVLNPSLPTTTPPPPSAAGGLPFVTPLPTSITTPVPGARIEAAERAVFLGDWDTALSEYRSALNSTTDPAIQSAASFGIARVHYAAGDIDAALDAINIYFNQFGDGPERGLAFFLTGEIFAQKGRYNDAAIAYGEYLAARPGLADQLAYSRIGDNLVAGGDYQGAINAYLSAIQSPQLGDGLSTSIKIGDAYRAMGDLVTARVTYQDVHDRTANGFVKASMLLRIGGLHIALGDHAIGYQAYAEAVNLYPQAPDAYYALVALVEAGQPVSELQRGIIDYYAGQYGVAIAALDRYRALNLPEQDDTAHYFLGLSYRAIGQHELAIAEWQDQLERFPTGAYFADAWENIGYTQVDRLSDFEVASATFELFQQTYPEHPRAPEFLFVAARIAERDFNLQRAASLWQRLGSRYSTHELGPDGLFQAGIALYRLGQYSLARDSFQSSQTIAQNREHQARAYFWAGKALAATGDHNGAQSMWSQARTIDPTGYYSERAAQLMRGESPFSPVQPTTFEFDMAAERAEAESWLILTFGLSADTNLADLSPLAADLRFQRGNELWHLGLLNEARLEFESLRQDMASDPANTYRLANHLIDLGLYRSGIIAARQLLNLAGYDDAGTFNAPIYFNHLRFGLYFQELVFPAAQAYDFDPLLLSSVIRQESLFEGFVVSSQGARGLMQVLPSTGAEINGYSGWPPNYSAADLYRPLVSVTFGADYLARQRRAQGGDLVAALAAYNGGPGNAAAWVPLAGGDPDLLVEVIRYEETRNYVRSIFEQYVIYVKLYAGGQ